jgi:hypothetical protein
VEPRLWMPAVVPLISECCSVTVAVPKLLWPSQPRAVMNSPTNGRYGGVHRPVHVAVLPSVSVLGIVRHACPILLGEARLIGSLFTHLPVRRVLGSSAHLVPHYNA